MEKNKNNINSSNSLVFGTEIDHNNEFILACCWPTKFNSSAGIKETS